MKKICVVTGSRADYWLLRHLLNIIRADMTFELQIIVTNMHLSPEFGLTYKDIENDGFLINRKLEMMLSSDTSNATIKSVGLGIIGFADAFEELEPDILLVLGDRYEILAAATAALFKKIPIIHLHGGEITKGAYDNIIRHVITKLSHVHFTSTDEYRLRVIQLGEEPDKVFNVGAIGLDNIKHLRLLSQTELENKLKFKFGEKCVLVTYHPATLENETPEKQMKELLKALMCLKDLRIIFTMPNSDTNGRIIIKMISKFIEENRERSTAFVSMGQIYYFSAIKFVKAVIGNSSSGIIEAPSFGVPTLNIGTRQQGRIRAVSVIDCKPISSDIIEKLKMILSPKFKMFCKDVYNPYEKEDTAQNIYSIIKNLNLNALILKRFHNLNPLPIF